MKRCEMIFTEDEDTMSAESHSKGFSRIEIIGLLTLETQRLCAEAAEKEEENGAVNKK